MLKSQLVFLGIDYIEKAILNIYYIKCKISIPTIDFNDKKLNIKI